MRYLFKRDTLLATASVFLVMGIFSIIPLNTHLLDPIKMALTDISFNDLSFSVLKTNKSNIVDDKIIIVNIGDDNREGIAKLITKLSTCNTKAIGLDVLFLSAKEPHVDSLLTSAIKNTPNIILSDKLGWEKNLSYQHDFFGQYAKNSGYVNFVGEEKGVIRYFSPHEKGNDTMYLSFSSAVVKVADENKFRILNKRDRQLELINYKRGVDQFLVVNDSDVVNNKVDTSLFKNKLIIIGYVNKNPFNIEDKHFTPLNEKFVGKSIPDMNGVILQANIVSMILNENYITKTPAWLNWFIAFILTWLFIAIVIRYYIERHIWFHLVAKSIQLLLTVIFIYLGIVFTRYLHVSINFNATLVAIILSVDVLYFFEGFTNWLHKKWGIKTVFTKSHA